MDLDENVRDAKRKKIERKLKDVPKVYREIYEKAIIGANQNAAIKAFCLECACWEQIEIINCTSFACPLYAVRPFVKKQGIARALLEKLRLIREKLKTKS